MVGLVRLVWLLVGVVWLGGGGADWTGLTGLTGLKSVCSKSKGGVSVSGVEVGRCQNGRALSPRLIARCQIARQPRSKRIELME
ncbi:hypothetical protein DL95DRAFT_396903, partial [Leptodontidium sp. 2 PMI_412]